MDSFSLFSGNASLSLSKKVAQCLKLELGKAKISTFSDGETLIEIKENVRRKEVFVIQSTSYPPNNNLFELLLMIDAFKRASAEKIAVVLPYFGYARQDRKVTPRVPISAKLVADLLTVAGATRIITMDLHSGQIQGFFNIPVDNIFAAPILIDYLKEKNETETNDLVIVSPDAGGVERARAFAKRLNAGLAMIDKRRDAPNKAKAMAVIGDVKNKKVIIVDDMVDTAGTLVQAVDSLLCNGAKEVCACCTHPVLSGPAIDRIKKIRIKKLSCNKYYPLKGRS